LIAFSLLCVLAFTPYALPAQQSVASTSTPASKPETVELAYRVRYEFHDEWFRISRKYQIAILNRQEQLGYVNEYTAWSPGLHTSEDSR
jgi:hypothetical protein